MRINRTNSIEDVVRLQLFLNQSEGENLLVDGVFGKLTEAAVHRYQQKHPEDILSPWGIDYSTGYVYILTKWFINEQFCPGTPKPQVQ